MVKGRKDGVEKGKKFFKMRLFYTPNDCFVLP